MSRRSSTSSSKKSGRRGKPCQPNHKPCEEEIQLLQAIAAARLGEELLSPDVLLAQAISEPDVAQASDLLARLAGLDSRPTWMRQSEKFRMPMAAPTSTLPPIF